MIGLSGEIAIYSVKGVTPYNRHTELVRACTHRGRSGTPMGHLYIQRGTQEYHNGGI